MLWHLGGLLRLSAHLCLIPGEVTDPCNDFVCGGNDIQPAARQELATGEEVSGTLSPGSRATAKEAGLTSAEHHVKNENMREPRSTAMWAGCGSSLGQNEGREWER